MPRLSHVVTLSAGLLLATALAGCSIAPTAAPTSTPEPSATPAVTAEPDVTAAEWLASFGDFDEETFSGSGVMEIPLPALGGLVTATHTGDTNFRMATRDAAGEPIGPNLVNFVGPYSGTTAWGFAPFDAQRAAILFVDSDGPYEITIAPLSSAPEFAVPLDGEGDSVFVADGDAQQVVAQNSNNRVIYVVQEIPDGGGKSVTIEASSTADVPIVAGPSLIVISGEAAGWSITR